MFLSGHSGDLSRQLTKCFYLATLGDLSRQVTKCFYLATPGDLSGQVTKCFYLATLGDLSGQVTKCFYLHFRTIDSVIRHAFPLGMRKLEFNDFLFVGVGVCTYVFVCARVRRMDGG